MCTQPSTGKTVPASLSLPPFARVTRLMPDFLAWARSTCAQQPRCYNDCYISESARPGMVTCALSKQAHESYFKDVYALGILVHASACSLYLYKLAAYALSATVWVHVHASQLSAAFGPLLQANGADLHDSTYATTHLHTSMQAWNTLQAAPCGCWHAFC